MKLLIAIVAYRVTDLAIDCLRSLSREIGRVPGARVALCENGSGGDAADRFRRAIAENGWESWVDLTVLYPNRGFTGGNNAIIRPALESADSPDYVLLLNADTVVHEHAVERLVTFMDANPAVGIAAGMEITAGGKGRSSPFRFPGIATELDRGLRLAIVSRLLSPWSILMLPPPQEACRAEWVSFAFAILRRKMLEQIGYLDEGLYTYFDDTDLCLRKKRRGGRLGSCPRARSTTSSGRRRG